MHNITAADAGRLNQQARDMLKRGEISRTQLTLFEALLWTCRRPGQSTARAAYTLLQRGIHAARSTIAAGLAALERVGLIARQKTRVLAIGANGGRVWRQLPNVYSFARAEKRPISRESDCRPDSKPQVLTLHVEVAPAGQISAQEALKRVRDRMLERQRRRLLD